MNSLILILPAVGFFNALWLYWQGREYRERGRPMVCPLNGHCEKVVFSEYGFTFGIKNELVGMAYYIALLAGLYLFSFYPAFYPFLAFSFLTATALAALVSLYLIYIQFFILRMFCSWCILANAINIAIFVSNLVVFL